MTPETVSEELPREIATLIAGAKSKEQVLHMLDKAGLDWHVSTEGDLYVKFWKVVAEDFVPREQVGLIRERMSSSCPEVNELEWISQNLAYLRTRYAGKWIGVCNGNVVGSAESLPELMEMIGDYEKPFVTQVPDEQIIWEFAYGFKNL